MKAKFISNVKFVISAEIKVSLKQKVEMISWNVIRNSGLRFKMQFPQLIYW